MPRTARRKSETGIYHIILRGANRQTIFEEEEDAEKFLDTLEDFKQVSGYKVYAYCSMGNHIHLLIKEEDEALGIIMRRIGASYVYWYNWKYERTGHLFQDRYKSEAVENEKYLLTVLRYIHQNPIKAGIVKGLGDYRWSSFSEYVSKNKIIDKDYILDLFGQDRVKATIAFEAFHRENKEDKCLDINEYRRIKDDEAIELIEKFCHISHCKQLQTLERTERNRCLKLLKEKGLSTRQIARLSGISRNIVLKV